MNTYWDKKDLSIAVPLLRIVERLEGVRDEELLAAKHAEKTHLRTLPHIRSWLDTLKREGLVEEFAPGRYKLGPEAGNFLQKYGAGIG